MGKIAVGIITVVAFLIGLGLAMLALNGCQYGKPACAVIDLAHTACDVIPLTVSTPDGGTATVQVPRREIQRVGLRYLPDGGAP